MAPLSTALQNVCFGLREKGLPAARQQELARHFLGKVGLADFGHHDPKQLSGGMQRASFLHPADATSDGSAVCTPQQWREG